MTRLLPQILHPYNQEQAQNIITQTTYTSMESREIDNIFMYSARYQNT